MSRFDAASRRWRRGRTRSTTRHAQVRVALPQPDRDVARREPGDARRRRRRRARSSSPCRRGGRSRGRRPDRAGSSTRRGADICCAMAASMRRRWRAMPPTLSWCRTPAASPAAGRGAPPRRQSRPLTRGAGGGRRRTAASGCRGMTTDNTRGALEAHREETPGGNKKKTTGTRAPTPARSTSPRPKKSVTSRSAPARRTLRLRRARHGRRTAPVWKSRPTKSEGRSATPSPRSCSRRVLLIDRCSRTRRTSVKSATPTRRRRGRRT